MASSFPLKPAMLLSALALTFVVTAPNASADTLTQHRVYRGRLVHYSRHVYVPLQPFSLGTASTRSGSRMTAAYYAPRRMPRAAEVDQDQNEEQENSAMPEPLTRGAHPTVSGNRAVLRNGVAYAPSNAPANVKSAIWAVNTIRSKPYHWGGGHGSFSDSGYDCSGTVSFALHHAGVLNQPLPSSDLLRFGERGRGRWITVYSRRGHTFAMIAGLRLDTTDFRYGGDVGPRWHTDGRETWGFEARHPVGL